MAEIHRTKVIKILRGNHGAESLEVAEHNCIADGESFQGAAGLGKHNVVPGEESLGIGHGITGERTQNVQLQSGVPAGLANGAQVRGIAGIVTENQRAPGLPWKGGALPVPLKVARVGEPPNAFGSPPAHIFHALLAKVVHCHVSENGGKIWNRLDVAYNAAVADINGGSGGEPQQGLDGRIMLPGDDVRGVMETT